MSAFNWKQTLQLLVKFITIGMVSIAKVSDNMDMSLFSYNPVPSNSRPGYLKMSHPYTCQRIYY